MKFFENNLMSAERLNVIFNDVGNEKSKYASLHLDVSGLDAMCGRQHVTIAD